MGLSKKTAFELLQVVEDSYARTANMKAAYAEYQRLLKKQNNWKQGASLVPLLSKELLALQEYEIKFQLYENSVKNGNHWYEGPIVYPGLVAESASTLFADTQHKTNSHAFLKKCEWKGTYFNKFDYSVEGNVYFRNGTYYLSFDGSTDVWDDFLTADMGIFLNNFTPWIEKAHVFYQTAKRRIPDLNAKNVIFLGHSLGGALSGSLAAAIYLNAFGSNNKFTPSRFQKENPEPMGDNIRAVTYNAPQMGGIFDKIIVEAGAGNYSVKITRIPESKLAQADVTSVGMKDDFVFNLHGREKGKNQIGNDMLVLTQNDGKLELLFETGGAALTELSAIAKSLGKAAIFTYLKTQIKEKVFWHFTSTLKIALDSREKVVSGQ